MGTNHHPYPQLAARAGLRVFICLAAVSVLTSCRRDQDAGDQVRATDKAQVTPQKLLDFPDELRVEDESVNDFVEQAMADCASGDYDRFRRLWSVREEPLPRDEYEQGWQAVRKIRIRALQKVILAPDPKLGREETRTGYAVLAEVALDPEHRAGERQPNREVVLMMIPEHDGWRLANTPKAIKQWIRKKFGIRQAAPPASTP